MCLCLYVCVCVEGVATIDVDECELFDNRTE